MREENYCQTSITKIPSKQCMGKQVTTVLIWCSILGILEPINPGYIAVLPSRHAHKKLRSFSYAASAGKPNLHWMSYIYIKLILHTQNRMASRHQNMKYSPVQSNIILSFALIVLSTRRWNSWRQMFQITQNINANMNKTEEKKLNQVLFSWKS